MAVIWEWAMRVFGGNGVEITRTYISFCNQLKLDQIRNYHLSVLNQICM